MYRSNLSLMAWFYAFFLFANSSSGMRSSFVRKQLGLGHRSAFRLCHQVRIHMATMPRPNRLGGTGKSVQIDEAALRYLVNPEGRANQTAIVLGLSCDGETISTIVPDRRARTLIPLIRKLVVPGSTIITDMHKAYSSLGQNGYDHIRINHSVAFHDFQGNTTNAIEVYWASVRRSLRGYRQVSPENLWTYLAEIEFRYNRRHRHDTAFEDLISHFESCLPAREDKWRSRFEWQPDRQPPIGKVMTFAR